MKVWSLLRPISGNVTLPISVYILLRVPTYQLTLVNLRKDLGQFPIQSAQILTACGQDNALLKTIVLCLNQTPTFSAPSKIKIF